MDTRAEKGGRESPGVDAIDELYQQWFGVVVALGLVMFFLREEQRIERA